MKRCLNASISKVVDRVQGTDFAYTDLEAWGGGMLEPRFRCISASGLVPPLAALRATP